ncbi:hypothetical protein JZ785_22780 [Alicyclobacillus curvatus]|nr:hypothetical protein JZ785_22780 [Alicyclobacillus curvatus]
MDRWQCPHETHVYVYDKFDKGCTGRQNFLMSDTVDDGAVSDGTWMSALMRALMSAPMLQGG